LAVKSKLFSTVLILIQRVVVGVVAAAAAITKACKLICSV
jgi:hypothetical protein